jgi:hypothetical protein
MLPGYCQRDLPLARAESQRAKRGPGRTTSSLVGSGTIFKSVQCWANPYRQGWSGGVTLWSGQYNVQVSTMLGESGLPCGVI